METFWCMKKNSSVNWIEKSEDFQSRISTLFQVRMRTVEEGGVHPFRKVRKKRG
jgi:hypothetical protein